MRRMKRIGVFFIVVVMATALIGFTAACGKNEKKEQPQTAQLVNKQEVDMALQQQADTFLGKYLADFETAYKTQAGAFWKFENSGSDADSSALEKADLALKQLHSDPQRFAEIEKLLVKKDKLKPLTTRSLQVAWLGFKGNQLPKEMLEKLTSKTAALDKKFNNYRAKIDGKEMSDNDLTGIIKAEKNSAKRKKIWEAEKQVGAFVAPDMIELAKVRNEAARSMGFKNFWDMQIRLQEHNPDQIVSIFDELEKETNEPFKQMKAKMDAELAARFKIKPEDMMPWHYDNPFFQAPPPMDKIDLDEFYKNKKSEDIVGMVKKFYNDIGLPIDDIVANSDLYERKGKMQHAFCMSLDLKGDARALLNITPTEYWADTILHEMGHGLYSKNTDVTLPFNIRDAAHPFTTEAVAQIFGALAKNPVWLVNYAGADPKRVKEVETALIEQRRREQLLFARWALVMLNFEKALYENPDQDLNKLWWDYVEKFQGLKRPEGRNSPDWAAKIHIISFPVYYHNYQLGELFAAQIRNVLVKMAKHQGPSYTLNYGQHKEFGDYFREKIFKPSATLSWPEFVKMATGEALTAKYFADELK